MKKANLWNIMKVISAHLATYALLLTSFAPVAVLANDPEPTPAATPAPEPTIDMSNMTEADIEAMNEVTGAGEEAAEALDEQNNGQSNLGEVDGTTAMWILIISGISIGFIAARILAFCKKLTYDSYLAAAAGIVYIYGEVKATVEDKEIREEIEEAYDKCKNEEDDCQYGALEAEKDSYDKIKETAEEKADLHELAGNGLLAAAAWAAGQGIYRTALRSSCHSLIGTGLAAADSAGAAKCAALTTGAAACAAEIVLCNGAMTAVSGMVETVEGISLFAQPSKLNYTETITALGTKKVMENACVGIGSAPYLSKAKLACNKYSMNVLNNANLCSFLTSILVKTNTPQEYGPHPIDNSKTQNLLEKFFEIKVSKNKQLHALIPDSKKRGDFVEFWRKAYFEGLDIFSPEVQAMAGFESWMGFGGAAIGIWYGLKKATATGFDFFITHAYGRAIFFGAMGGVIHYSALVTRDIANEVCGNSDKIASVLNNRRNKNEEGTEIERQGRERQDVVTTTGNGTAAGTVETDGASETPPLCANGENGNGGCNSISANGGGDTSFLDGFLGTNGASNLLVVANDVNDGSINAQSRKVVSSNRGTGAIAMRKLRKQKTKLMDALKKDDVKSYEKMKKLDDYVQKSIQSGVMKVLKKNKVAPSQFLAAVGTGKMPSLKETEKNKRVAAIKGSITGKKVGSIGLGGTSGKKDWSMKFNFDEEAAKEEVTAVSGNSEAMAMSEDNGKVVGSTTAEDIMGRNNNIWQEITKRYIRTAYPVLLE